MFRTHDTPATLANLTAYSEKRGDETVSGLALKMVLDLPAGILDSFRPKLTEAFFRLDSRDIEVRFPEIEGIRWGREIMGARVLIGYEDLLGSEPVELPGAIVDHFRFAPKNGGTVEVTLRIKVKPDGAVVGRLYEWLQKEVQLTIEPPTSAAADQPDDLVSKAEAVAA